MSELVRLCSVAHVANEIKKCKLWYVSQEGKITSLGSEAFTSNNITNIQDLSKPATMSYLTEQV